MKQFPFSAVVGMEDAKRSLIYHAIDPRIGGSLLLGHRGCAKTTLVRAFAELLQASSSEPIPFVELPLGATEDRLLGSVNAEALVEQNKWETRTGLIEEANGGVLYVDEINLLPDNLADQILDSAASGKHHLERDGITRLIESRFILIGTMNPEEGDLRPQLSDRFAHGILIQDDFTPDQRVEVVRRRIQFDDDPESFIQMQAASLTDLAERVTKARTLVKSVTVSEAQRLEIANRARELQVEGLRAELAVLRTARCAAAWETRSKIESRHLDEAWRMCLGHRHLENRPPTRAPSPPPPPGQRFNPPVAQRTSHAPINSLPDPKRLSQATSSPHQRLRDWAKNQIPGLYGRGARLASVTSDAVPHGAINWIATLLNSIPFSKTSSINLHYYSVRRRPRVWCFLDASRSTGMSRCLSAARDSLIDLAAHFRSGRWNLLLLRDNRIKWVLKQSSFRSFRSVLGKLDTAGGKSYLFQSLRSLHRAILKHGPTSQDRVVIVSDGLATLEAGHNYRDTPSRLRHSLRRITQLNVSTAWLYPSSERALAKWLQKVLKGLPVTSIKL
ncbi:MAG TPA: AAA family ATPase [Chthoniobacterales bacterium]|nr:AAA family ATPase [Chthoniobacterales bacterium]